MILMMIIILTVPHLFPLCITGKYASDMYYFMLKRCVIQMAENVIYILNVALNIFECLQNINVLITTIQSVLSCSVYVVAYINKMCNSLTLNYCECHLNESFIMEAPSTWITKLKNNFSNYQMTCKRPSVLS